MAHNLRKRKRVWVTVGKGSSLPTNEPTDLKRNARDDIIMVDIKPSGKSFIRIIHSYDQRGRETGERRASRLDWQKIIR